MDNNRRQSFPAVPGVGIARDLQRLRSDGAASIAEIREFVKQMHGKDPQEVLGTVAQSGLFLSMVASTAIFGVVLAAFTVGPFLWGASAADETAASKKPKKPAPAKAETEPEKTAATDAAAKTDGGKPAAPGQIDVRKAADKMGENETKAAPSDKNPLDIDKLIDIDAK